MLVLFINSINKQCGVYQYGVRLYNILKKCLEIEYKYFEIDNINNYNLLLTQFPNATHIIYNYHTSTMGWLNNNIVCKTTTNIGIPHESSNNCFDITLNIDPNGLETDNFFNIPRPIYENVDEMLTNYTSSTQEIHKFITYKENNLPIFGSFGFGFQNKGFDKIVNLINQTYENAIIKIIMPFAHYDPNAVNNYNSVYTACLKYNVKPGIKLMIITSFCSNEDILYFLKSNDMNIFLYDTMQGRGISSVFDYALSVNTPFGISDSYMFRHIYSDEICLYKTELPNCYSNSLKHVKLFQITNSHKNVICKFKQIMNNNNSVKTHCEITIQDEEMLYDKLSEINYLSSKYDIITFNTNLIDQISNIFNQSNIFKQSNIFTQPIVTQSNIITTTSSINLNDYSITSELKNIHEPKPLTYLSEGKLGDLIHNLSVINEIFYKTGRKGILYISDNHDKFEYGLVNTYNDTKNVISSQRYIKTYKIYENEPFDINLNVWRNNPLSYRQNFYNTYKQTYNIEWGKHKWIKIPLINYALKDKVLINISSQRFKNIDYNEFKTKYGGENLIFICFDKSQYTYFVNKTNMNIKCMQVKNFDELCLAINSCKLFIGSQSMPLALTNSLFIDSIILQNNPNVKLHENFNIVFKNVIDII